MGFQTRVGFSAQWTIVKLRAKFLFSYCDIFLYYLGCKCLYMYVFRSCLPPGYFSVKIKVVIPTSGTDFLPYIVINFFLCVVIPPGFFTYLGHLCSPDEYTLFWKTIFTHTKLEDLKFSIISNMKVGVLCVNYCALNFSVLHDLKDDWVLTSIFRVTVKVHLC